MLDKFALHRYNDNRIIDNYIIIKKEEGMAVADRSIDPRILSSAKKEFLQKGFLNASLQEICKEAGVTTGALYKRFKGKEELFCAVVQGTVDDLSGAMRSRSVPPETLSDEQLKKAWDMDRAFMLWWFRFLYERYDGVRLLLTCAEGTKYSAFEHEWVESMSSITYAYYKEAQRRGLTKTDISEKELHVMLTAFWTAICEPLVHDFSFEEASRVSDLMCGLFDWYKMLGFER